LSKLTAVWLLVLLVLTLGWAAGACRPAPGDEGPPPADGGQDGGTAPESPSFEELLAAPAADELPGRLVVYFLDAGQADASVIRTPGGRIVVIDTGEGPEPLVGFLEAKGVERVDVLVLSHPHADHIGGAPAVLDEFEVGLVVDSGFAHTTQLYRRVLTRIIELRDAGRIQWVAGRAGGVIECDPEITVEILHPDEPLGASVNEASVVVRVTFGSFSVLFTGDIGHESERAILVRGRPVDSTVLKVAHHGSAGSSGEGFLRAAGPTVAVIQVGAGNRYGHPSPEVVGRLEAMGVEVYTTARDGTVIVHSDGKTFTVLVGP
jgi:beta-lactamase superfamily II metal-dependent hydrolase